jgi:hypothetical protein
MLMMVSADSYYYLLSPSEANKADMIVKSKFRGVDPWILAEGKVTRLTAFDPIFGEEYQRVKEKMAEGWYIKLLELASIR